MTTIEAPLQMVVCERCSRPTGEFSRERRTTLGSCCADLPTPWPIGGPNGYDEDEDPDYEHDSRPACPWCESREFTATEIRRESQHIDARDNDDLDDSSLYVSTGYGDADYETTVECASCARDCTNHISVEWS